MKSKKLSEKDMLLEVERIANLIVFYGQDEQSLDQCRTALKSSLTALGKYRSEQAAIKVAREAEKKKKKHAQSLKTPGECLEFGNKKQIQKYWK